MCPTPPGSSTAPGRPGLPSTAAAPVGVGTSPSPDELTRVVALDGPAGSGKSTVSRRVAAALGWRFVDTGATYRAAALAVLRAGVDLSDSGAVAAIARQAGIELSTDPADSWVRLDGEDVSVEIRGPEVTAHVSAVSAIPEVRRHLVQLQRRAMGVDGAVVEGRDIATVVAPLAGVKVYLDASPEVRARRRAGEDLAGVHVSGGLSRESAVETDLRRRDDLDNQTNRLEASDGAVHIDTDDLSLEEVVASVVALVRAAGLAEGAHADPSEDDRD